MAAQQVYSNFNFGTWICLQMILSRKKMKTTFLSQTSTLNLISNKSRNDLEYQKLIPSNWLKKTRNTSMFLKLISNKSRNDQ